MCKRMKNIYSDCYSWHGITLTHATFVKHMETFPFWNNSLNKFREIWESIIQHSFSKYTRYQSARWAFFLLALVDMPRSTSSIKCDVWTAMTSIVNMRIPKTSLCLSVCLCSFVRRIYMSLCGMNVANVEIAHDDSLQFGCRCCWCRQ